MQKGNALGGEARANFLSVHLIRTKANGSADCSGTGDCPASVAFADKREQNPPITGSGYCRRRGRKTSARKFLLPARLSAGKGWDYTSG